MKKLVIIAVAFLLSLSAYAQTADFVTEMLDTKTAAYGQVCYLSAVYQGFVDDAASYDDAVRALYINGQIPAIEDKTKAVDYEELARLMVRMWPVKGGLMFRLTKGSARYAFRQLKVDGIIPQDADPSKKVSGTEVLNMYTGCQKKYGSNE
jgi:hypothetical protein